MLKLHAIYTLLKNDETKNLVKYQIDELYFLIIPRIALGLQQQSLVYLFFF